MSDQEQINDIFETKEINLLEYWTMIWKRKWMITAIAVLTLSIAAIKTYTKTPVFVAKGTLLVEKDEPNFLSFQQIFQAQSYWGDDFNKTQVLILTSRKLAEEVVDRLKLVEKAFQNQKKENPEITEPDPLLKRSVISSIRNKLKVHPIEQTRFIEISYSHPEPDFAALIVNTFFDTFINMNIDSKFAATKQASEFLSTQIERLREEILEKENDFQTYSVKKNIIALNDNENTIIDKLSELNKAYSNAQINRINKQSYYEAIKNSSLDNFPETFNNPIIQNLKEEYSTLKRQYEKMSQTYGPGYPEMLKVKKELESAKENLTKETKGLINTAYAEYKTALKNENSLGKAFNDQKKTAIQMNSDSISYNSLKIEIENSNNLLDSLVRREKETGITARLRGLRTSNITVLDRAEVPLSPSSPNKKKDMMLGLMLGLVGGIGLSFVIAFLDNSIKNSDDVERYAKLPTLGIIPKFNPKSKADQLGYSYGYGQENTPKSNKKNVKLSIRGNSSKKPTSSLESNLDKSKITSIELITHTSPGSYFSESYRSIRTAFLLSSVNRNLKVVLATSSLPSEGKSTTISNLAITLAQTDKKVLLIDADLRKPRLHTILNLKNKEGLTNYLTSSLELKDFIKTTIVPNLNIITAGPVPPNPAELLNSNKMMTLVEELRKKFDYVLIDAPPVIPVSDALILKPCIDGIIMVVWGGVTSRDVLKRAKEKLTMLNIKTLGVIINQIKMEEHSFKKNNYSYYKYSDHNN